MRIELTDKCNLNCSYCHASPNKKQQVIENQTILNIINKLGTGKRPTLSGGEPFLVFDKMLTAIQMIETHKPKDFAHIKIQTNATLITQEYCDILKDYTVSFRVSMDGPTAEIHNIHRQQFDETVRGIELLVKNGFDVSTTYVISPSNYKHILEHIEFCEFLGLSLIQFRRVLYDDELTKEMILEALITVDYAKSCNKYDIGLNFKECEQTDSGMYCRGRKCFLANGDINPCGNIKYTIGNINTDYPKDIVEHRIWDFLCNCGGCPMNKWEEEYKEKFEND